MPNPLTTLLPGSAMHDTFGLQPPRDITDGMPPGASEWTPPLGERIIPGNYQNNMACAARILENAKGGYYLWPRLRPHWRQAAVNIARQAASTGTMVGLKTLFGPPESGLMDLMPPGHAYIEAHNAVDSFVRPLMERPFLEVSTEDVPLIIRGALDILKAEFEKIRSEVPPELARATDKSIADLQREVEKFKPGQHSYFDPASLYSDFKTIFYHLSFPAKAKDILQHTKKGDAVKAEELDLAHEELVSSFPESIQGSLHEVIRMMRFNSVVEPDVKPITVFAGQPATGKTHLVKALAERFDVPVLIVNAAELSELLSVPNMNRMYGGYYGMNSDLPDSLSATQRKLLQDIQTAPIVCLDEMDPDAHPELWNALKAWSSGKPAELNGTEGVNVLPDSTTLIITTNKVAEMEAVLDPQDGVRRRTTLIKFPAWPHDKLRVRANEHLDSYITKCADVFRPETIHAVEPIARDILDFELKELAKYDVGMLDLGELQKRVNLAVATLIMEATIPARDAVAAEKTIEERLQATANRLKKEAAATFAGMNTRTNTPAAAGANVQPLIHPGPIGIPLQSSTPLSTGVQFPGKGRALRDDINIANPADAGQAFMQGMAGRFGPVPYPPSAPTQQLQTQQQINPIAKKVIDEIANLTPDALREQYRPRILSEARELAEAPSGVLVKIGDDGTLYFQSVLHREPHLTSVAGCDVPPSLSLTIGQPLTSRDRKIWELTHTERLDGPYRPASLEAVTLRVGNMSREQLQQEFDIEKIETREALRSRVRGGSKLVKAASDGSLYLYDDTQIKRNITLQRVLPGVLPPTTAKHFELCEPITRELTSADRQHNLHQGRHRR